MTLKFDSYIKLRLVYFFSMDNDLLFSRTLLYNKENSEKV